MDRIRIHGFGHHGEGVGSLDGYTLFVEDALPGETIDVEITERHKRYAKAKLLNIHAPSPDRVSPPCPLFGTCGGCQVMHLSYEKQLEMKRQKVIDALLRIGRIDASVASCIPSPSPLAYRNKIQLPMQDGKLGLYMRNSHALVPVKHCYIHCDLGEEIYQKVRPFLEKKLPTLRHLLIKSAIHSQEALVILVTKEPVPRAIGEEVLALSSSIKGVISNLHEGKENVILGPRFETLAGQSAIIETLCGLTFTISPASFFQVNTLQAEQLYTKALSLADLRGTETVLDAYCGVGTLSLFFARKAKRVIGVESVASAIEDAEQNAQRNHITNTSFHTAKAEHFISKLKEMDLILLNPPRKGCDPAFLAGVGRLLPKQLIYISCDPATLARDLMQLISYGYKIDTVQPFDMFPQTAHVETLVLLRQANR